MSGNGMRREHGKATSEEEMKERDEKKREEKKKANKQTELELE